MVKITDTTLRDGHQSLYATRFRTEDIVRIAEAIDDAGFHSLEVWGGATFDAPLRFLNENPWERLRALRKVLKNTPMQMLLRGQNLVGYRHYPDDVVELFVRKAVENGIEIFRIFDALNDLRNVRTSVKAVKNAGAHAQGCIVYTISPVHTTEKYVELANELAEMDVDSICIKDMAGLLSPPRARELVGAIKRRVSLPVQVHTHSTAGWAVATCLGAVEGGADVVDTCIHPVAFGSAQPAIQTVAVALRDGGYEVSVDMDVVERASHIVAEAAEKYRKYTSPRVRGIEPRILAYQVPGGMLSNLQQQLREMGIPDRFDDVLKEIEAVRRELGYPPLVTPLSQIVGTQAALNVLTGERYKMVPKETKKYVLGYYGRPPAPIDEAVRRKIAGDEKGIDCRPADLLEPMLDDVRRKYSEYIRNDEDLLTFALFPDVALRYFRGEGGEEDRKSAGGKRYIIRVDGEEFDVEVEEVR